MRSMRTKYVHILQAYTQQYTVRSHQLTSLSTVAVVVLVVLADRGSSRPATVEELPPTPTTS
jgi:hypothetical protein